MPGPQPPELTVVQLSDTHLRAGGGLLAGAIDTLANLDAALAQLVASGVRPSLLLHSGDLSDDGSEDSYRIAADRLGHAAAALGGCPVVVTLGNHDDRRGFRAGFLGDASAEDEPYTWVVEVDGMRVVGLDSIRPGRPDGALDDSQLEWLADVLATPAERGTILALHHPPVPGPVGPMNAMGLRDPQRLGDVVRGSDVRMIVSGHVHHASVGVLAGVPVWSSPALAYTMDTAVGSDAAVLRGLGSVGFTRLDVRGADVVASAVLLDHDQREVVRWG